MELNRIFETGHITHKKVMIHAMNRMDEWFEKDLTSNSKSSERKKFIGNFEIFKKALNPKALINAFER